MSRKDECREEKDVREELAEPERAFLQSLEALWAEGHEEWELGQQRMDRLHTVQASMLRRRSRVRIAWIVGIGAAACLLLALLIRSDEHGSRSEAKPRAQVVQNHPKPKAQSVLPKVVAGNKPRGLCVFDSLSGLEQQFRELRLRYRGIHEELDKPVFALQ
ncbi:MAG: hypothetical protein D6820_11150 [Lentisphaerae bacterium]|nr:MAG: hypothetical protein D6820_11150 [Lentisphaerota bacterium]